MKTLMIAAGLIAALNSSNMWGEGFLTTFQGTPEPVRLIMWGLALFVIASSLKKRSHSSQRVVVNDRSSQRPWLSTLRPRFEGLNPAETKPVALDARKLEAGV
jgi:hypothetical protein